MREVLCKRFVMKYDWMTRIISVTTFSTKGKAIPAIGGLRGSVMLRIPDCLENRLTDGGKVVKPYALAALYSPKT
jgi:hypothetical protein